MKSKKNKKNHHVVKKSNECDEECPKQYPIFDSRHQVCLSQSRKEYCSICGSNVHNYIEPCKEGLEPPTIVTVLPTESNLFSN